MTKTASLSLLNDMPDIASSQNSLRSRRISSLRVRLRIITTASEPDSDDKYADKAAYSSSSAKLLMSTNGFLLQSASEPRPLCDESRLSADIAVA